ncbi:MULTISPECIES: hypothetical protein [unclassified Streptomyces]|uniref:VMAP-C domain-containing protein n=1 Tax=unclassified Streptomyces TaxID=2593676 RepID=UPI00210CED88|nr:MULTISPECIES: hypothetical protein [unclassified Streptomyces]
MCAVTGLDAPEGRDLLINMLASRLPELGNIRRHGRTRPEMLEIVRACLREPGGLPELAATLNDYAPNTVPVLRISELAVTSPVLAVLSEADSREVHSLLSRVRHLDVRGVLYAAAGELTLPDRRVSTLRDAFDFLSQVNARADGLLPVMALVEHVVAALEGDAHRQVADGLRAWNDAQARRLGTGAQLKALRAEIAQAPTAQPAPACLVIQLSRHGMTPDHYLLSHWRQIRPGPWRPERGEDQIVALKDVEATVERLVVRAERDWAGRPGRPVLEFVLPFHLLNHPLEWLPMASQSSSSTALCLSYPVVLRSLERMRAREFHRRWHNRWQQMTEDAGIVCHWDTTGRRGHDPVQWTSRLTADERLVSVALNAPPLPGPAGSRASLEAALRAGVPLAVWDRRPAPPGEFRKRVKKIIKGKPIELPQRVQQLRNEAATAAAAQRDAHAGRHFAVLFDDPNRIVDGSSPGADSGSTRGGHDDEGDS